MPLKVVKRANTTVADACPVTVHALTGGMIGVRIAQVRGDGFTDHTICPIVKDPVLAAAYETVAQSLPAGGTAEIGSAADRTPGAHGMSATVVVPTRQDARLAPALHRAAQGVTMERMAEIMSGHAHFLANKASPGALQASGRPRIEASRAPRAYDPVYAWRKCQERGNFRGSVWNFVSWQHRAWLEAGGKDWERNAQGYAFPPAGFENFDFKAGTIPPELLATLEDAPQELNATNLDRELDAFAPREAAPRRAERAD